MPAVRWWSEKVQGNPWVWTTLASGLLAFASTVWAAGNDPALRCLKDLAPFSDADAVVTGWNRDKPLLLIPVRPFRTRAPGPSKFYVLLPGPSGKYEARIVDLSQGSAQFQLKGIPGAFEHHFSEAMAKGHPGTTQWDYRAKLAADLPVHRAEEQLIEGDWPLALQEALQADLGRRLARLRTRLELLKQRDGNRAEKSAEAQALLDPIISCGPHLAAEVRKASQPACTDGREPASAELKLPPMQRSWCEYQRVMALGKEMTGSRGALAQARRPASARPMAHVIDEHESADSSP